MASMQIVLFTSKAETPGIFRALAANMRNTTFLFADVSAESVGILEQFGIKKVICSDPVFNLMQRRPACFGPHGPHLEGQSMPTKRLAWLQNCCSHQERPERAPCKLDGTKHSAEELLSAVQCWEGVNLSAVVRRIVA